MSHSHLQGFGQRVCFFRFSRAMSNGPNIVSTLIGSVISVKHGAFGVGN
jgi:hypothetical protein